MAEPLSNREAWALYDYRRKLNNWKSGQGEEMSDEDWKLLSSAEDGIARGSVPTPGQPGASPAFSRRASTDPAEDIRLLREAINAGKGDSTPRRLPDYPGSDPLRGPLVPEKSDYAKQNDARQDAFYQHIAAKYPPRQWDRLPPDIRRNMEAYAGNADGFQDRIRSQYQTTGMMGPGSTLGSLGSWTGAFPGMLFAGGDMVGNNWDRMTSKLLGGTPANPHGNAGERMGKSFATAIAPMRAMTKPITDALYGETVDPLPSSYFQDGRDIVDEANSIRDAAPWDSWVNSYSKPSKKYTFAAPDPTPAGKFRWDDDLNRATHASMNKPGEDYFMGHGLPQWAAAPMGAAADAIFNPFFGAGEAVAASKLAPAAWPLAKWGIGELGFDAALLGHRALSPHLPQEESETDALIRRLEESSR